MKTKKNDAVAIFGQAELDAAEVFLDTGAEIKRQTKDREEAKATLLEALGDKKVGVLPDGRTVRLTIQHFEAATIERQPYDSKTLHID